MYEQELKHRQLLEKKILTSEESKYDEIGLPKLNIKQLKESLKLSDNHTLNNVVELLKIDYIDMMRALADSLEDANKYEISVASNSIRRRIQAWIEVLSRWNTTEQYFDRATWEMKQVKKK